MKILVGLGNPDKRYEGTPHNVGFVVLDELARRLSCKMRGSFWFKARMGKAAFGNEDLLFVKPETYMNRSGSAVAAIMRYKKIAPTDLIVALDDADLDLGRIRIRPKGGSAGHKGLGSVIQSIGGEEFARVRIGIGRNAKDDNLVEQVLTPFSKEEQEEMTEATNRAADAILCILEFGVDAAMNKFNTRNAEQTEKH